MRLAKITFLLAAVACLPLPAGAAERRLFAIPPSNLAQALTRFGVQAGISIGALDKGVQAARTRGVSGYFSTEKALVRLLAGSGYTYVAAGAAIIRIVPAPPRHAKAPPAPPLPPVQPGDIVVTASKRDAPLKDFAGGVDILDLDSTASGAGSASGPGTEAALSRLPMIATTNLGQSRNKLFIRGVADSSFTGPTQATAGQYLGNVRLTYNAPDPDLNLYDIQRIEVLQGPQGTLYGAGSLGGIIRLVPNMPDPSGTYGSLDGGLSTTQHGAPSGDVAGMLNLPISGALSLRAVAYRSIAGGYIDDALRGLSNINRTKMAGGRATLRVEPGGGWIVDISAVRQDTYSRDSQYAERGFPPLTRASAIAQPFDNDYTLGAVNVSKSWGALDFVSSSGIVHHQVNARYDATGYYGTGPAALDEDDEITLLSNETRLSRHYARGSWVVGASVIYDIDRITRGLGDPDSPRPTNGVRNGTTEAALFGEATRRIARGLSLTLGGRVSYSRISGSPLDDDRVLKVEGLRTGARASPSAGLSWQASAPLLIYFRYQEGYRPGGLALGDGTEQGATRFRSDNIRTAELGLRFGRQDVDKLTATASVSGSLWSNIQADLVDAMAQPYTANIGDGRVLSFQASVHWTPIPAIEAEAAAFASDSALKDPAPGFASANEQALPNIPKLGLRAGLFFRQDVTPDMQLRVGGSARYVGHSRLGVGPMLDLIQGGYVDSILATELRWKRYAFSLSMTNVANVRSNRFSLGNPFGVGNGLQITPLRPRTVRLGVHAAF